MLSHLMDVYTLRNVIAHQAGIVDEAASRAFIHFNFAPSARVILSPEVLVKLAAHVIKIADLLDPKTISEYDNTLGAHRPAVVAETRKRRPPKIRPSSGLRNSSKASIGKT